MMEHRFQGELMRPMPPSHTALLVNIAYPEAEFALIQQGFSPQRYTDQWYMVFEDSILFMYRFETQACLYQVYFSSHATRNHHIAYKIIINRDPDQYQGVMDDEFDTYMIFTLINSQILNKPFSTELSKIFQVLKPPVLDDSSINDDESVKQTAGSLDNHAQPRLKILKEWWHHLKPMPAVSKMLTIGLEFTPAEYETLCLGFGTADMDYHWVVYVEDDWIFIHRSWTGICIYHAKITPLEDRYVIDAFTVNRGQYLNTDDEYDRVMFRFVIEWFVLEKDVPIPDIEPSGD